MKKQMNDSIKAFNRAVQLLKEDSSDVDRVIDCVIHTHCLTDEQEIKLAARIMEYAKKLEGK